MAFVVELSNGTVIVSGRILGFFVRLDVKLIVVFSQIGEHVCGHIILLFKLLQSTVVQLEESFLEQLYWSHIGPYQPGKHSHVQL